MEESTGVKGVTFPFVAFACFGKHYGDIGFVLFGPMGNRRNFRHASVYPRGVLSHAKS